MGAKPSVAIARMHSDCAPSNAAGLRPFILSTEANPVVIARAKKLRVRCLNGVKDKLQALETILDEFGCSMEQTAFVGNDINDADCLGAVGLPIVVEDAHPSVLPLARYRTTTRGGYGAVREVCDLIAKTLTTTKSQNEPNQPV